MTWLHADYSKPLEPPVRSKPDGRSRLLLIALIWQFSVTRALRWRKRDVDGKPGDETFCNFFTVAVATAMGVLLPQLRANELFGWLQGPEAKAAGWEKADAHTAQRVADEGMLAIAVSRNPNGPGHIAPLVPSLGEPGTWIANVGRTNFERGKLEEGFASYVPDFYVHA